MAVAAAPAGAQSLSDIPGPAELPPLDYAEKTYVDSRGCVFLRAGYGGQETWIPRVTKDRKPLCGYAPTEVASTRPAPVAPVVAAPADVAPAEAAAADVAPAEPTPPASEAATAAPAPQPALEPAAIAPEPAAKAAASEPAVTAPAPPPALAEPEVVEPPRTAAAPRKAVAPRKAAASGAKAGRTPALDPTRGLYVQAGSFAVPANADAARDRLRALGLPTAHAEIVTPRGQQLRVVFVGPIADPAGRRAALDAVRAAGFRDAFIR